MAIIETTDDLIRLLREDEEFLEAARREILTQELLRLPALVAELSAQFAEFSSRTNARLENLESDVGTLKSDVSTLKGFGLEARLQTKALSKIAGSLRLRRTRVLRLTDDSRGSEDFTDAMWNAQDAGTVSERDYNRILDTDMIVKGERGDARGIAVYIAVEASFTSNGDDLSRALRSAEVLKKVFPDAEVLAALHFSEISEQDLGEARDAGVITISDK